MTAGALPSIARVHETRPRGHQRSSSTVEDDWLGDISDDDWDESVPERAESRRASPASHELPSPEVEDWPPEVVRAADPAARRVAAAEDHRAVIERRRLVAGLVVVVVLALGAVIAVLLLRDGDQAPVAPVAAPTSTTPAPGETRPSAGATAPSPSTTPSSTPSTDGASTFALPEGTKLQRGEGDPALIEELQQALSKAGYDPGPADGTFGRLTEAAVVAFQEANGLSVDGRVGPETASALNSAVADG